MIQALVETKVENKGFFVFCMGALLPPTFSLPFLNISSLQQIDLSALGARCAVVCVELDQISVLPTRKPHVRFIALVKNLEQITQALQQGFDDYVFMPCFNEILLLHRISQVAKTFSQVPSIKEDHLSLAYRAFYDGQTGLPNRASFDEECHGCIQRYPITLSAFSIVFIDIDSFKEINDQYGHAVGDQLLVHVAQCLKKSIRKSDLVARYAGDEFAVLLRNVAHKDAIKEIVHRLLYAIQPPYRVNNSLVKISVSMGIACYPYDAKTFKDLFYQADQAMYTSKRLGKNCYTFSEFVEKT